jgi:hypothetical protein
MKASGIVATAAMSSAMTTGTITSATKPTPNEIHGRSRTAVTPAR